MDAEGLRVHPPERPQVLVGDSRIFKPMDLDAGHEAGLLDVAVEDVRRHRRDGP
jgi:hypothetical protein